MYRDVLPLLNKFDMDHKKSDNVYEKSFIDMFPKFFGAGEINGDLILVFEDILDGMSKSMLYCNMKRIYLDSFFWM